MAKIKEIVVVEDNLFNFDSLVSFQTESYIGEWNNYAYAFMVYNKDSVYAGEVVDMIYANDLEELVYHVKTDLDEEIEDVYDVHIINITFDV